MMVSAGRRSWSSHVGGASVGTSLLVLVGSREVRPEVVPTGRIVDLAFGAMRGVLADPAVRRIFLIFGVSFLATQMSRPYIPVVVERLTGNGPGLIGHRARRRTAALVGGLVSPLAVLGDRIGFRPVLVASLVAPGSSCCSCRSSVRGGLAALAVVLGIDGHRQRDGLRPPRPGGPGRSSVRDAQPGHLPLYAAGIVGPAIGAGVATAAGVTGRSSGGVIFVLGAIGILTPADANTDPERPGGDHPSAIGAGVPPVG
jgi:hypothetical protein